MGRSRADWFVLRAQQPKKELIPSALFPSLYLERVLVAPFVIIGPPALAARSLNLSSASAMSSTPLTPLSPAAGSFVGTPAWPSASYSLPKISKKLQRFRVVNGSKFAPFPRSEVPYPLSYDKDILDWCALPSSRAPRRPVLICSPVRPLITYSSSNSTVASLYMTGETSSLTRC
jgi:hypothetical protein